MTRDTSEPHIDAPITRQSPSRVRANWCLPEPENHALDGSPALVHGKIHAIERAQSQSPQPTACCLFWGNRMLVLDAKPIRPTHSVRSKALRDDFFQSQAAEKE
ncbi:Uncharacterised protein [Vibrio cholerae]|nr:Uncharacterised protein [Vibrio cholerae]